MKFQGAPFEVFDNYPSSTEKDRKFAIVEPIQMLGRYDGHSTHFSGLDWPNPDTSVGDPPFEWDVLGTFATYPVGFVTKRNNKLYYRTVAGNLGVPGSSSNWQYMQPVNAFCMFDASNTTQTRTNAAAGTYKEVHWTVDTFSIDYMDTVVLDNVVCDTITIIVYDQFDNTRLYIRTIDFRDNTASDWWDYFFKVRENKTTAIFQNLPQGASTIVEFIATASNGDIRIGTLVLGKSIIIGEAQYDTRVGINDYSTKEVDSFGNATLTQRKASKRMSVDVKLSNDNVDQVMSTLARYRATPAMWLGLGNVYSSLTMYGFYKDFDIVIPGFNTSICSIEIEGLT